MIDLDWSGLFPVSGKNQDQSHGRGLVRPG